MIKSNLIKNDNKSYAVDFTIGGPQHKIIVEYLFILYNLVANQVIDRKLYNMFYDIIDLAIQEGNDFEDFANGVISTYLKSEKEGD